MLIYNFQKEFIGIDEEDLQALGYANLAELRAEAADFADLFVKTPGHIHNFKHVHWIDFLDCADSTTPTKAIIHAKDKNYRCTLSIRSFYLTDYPASKAYTIYLEHLIELRDGEISSIADDIANRSVAQKVELTATTERTPTLQKIEEKPTPTQINIPRIEEEPLKVEEEFTPVEVEKDEPLDIIFDIEDEIREKREVQETVPVTPIFEKSVPEKVIVQEPEEPVNDYIYNPEIASTELGLPVDLIEEFVEDFIAQAKEFKAQLYNALQEQDMDGIKSLSHKLKGVAANLHIEDAFETLAIINTSDKYDEISSKLNLFYRIIAKLANEEATAVAPAIEQEAVQTEPEVLEEEDIYQNLLIDDVEEIEEELVEDETPTLNYDPRLIADEIGLDVDTFNELLADYITESISSLENLKQSISVGNAQEWQNEAKQFKSMSQNMRVDDISVVLDELITSDDSFEAEEILQKLDAYVSQISILKA